MSCSHLSSSYCRNMTGVEYVLLHVQEPILYIVRKQYRHSPQQSKLQQQSGILTLCNTILKSPWSKVRIETLLLS